MLGTYLTLKMNEALNQPVLRLLVARSPFWGACFDEGSGWEAHPHAAAVRGLCAPPCDLVLAGPCAVPCAHEPSHSHAKNKIAGRMIPFLLIGF